jgi:hypothetical protein
MCPGAALENFAFQHLNCATDTRSTIESLISIFEIVPLMADAVTGLLSLTRPRARTNGGVAIPSADCH